MSAHDDERRGSLNDGNGVGAGSAAGEGAERVVLVTVTYLEMTSPDQFTAPPEWAEPVTVLRAERPTISFYRYLYDTVGADWDWYERRRLSDEALAAIIHDDAVEVFVLYVRGVPAGYVELDRRVDGEVEIAYFGLVPDYIGRRLGSCLLGWALERAWGYGPDRVWVHTCSLDHPRALSVYCRAGFEVYDRRALPVETTLLDLVRQGRRRTGAHLTSPRAAI